MRAKVARRLRKVVYGKGHHPGPVRYFMRPKTPRVIITDDQRRAYRGLKRAYLRGEFVL